MDRLARTARIGLVLVALAACLGGCVAINSTSTSQPQSMGPLRLTVSACANGSPGCSGTSNTGSLYAFLDGADTDQTLPVQLLLAVRLPDGAVPPDALTAALAGGGTLAFNRNAGYEAELQALEPAPAGERWWGWLSPPVDYGRTTKQGFTVTIEVTLPRAADGGPLPSPMHWRPVVGGREIDLTNQPNLTAARPVECGSTNADLYDGIDERGNSQPTIVCVDAPAADATRGFLDAPLTDFGILGTAVQAPAGSTVTATFLAKRSGAADPGTAFALAVAGGAPGGTVTIDQSSVSLGGDSTTPVLATVVIPPGTAPGTYPITLTATASGKPTREGTATLTVPEPQAPSPAPPGPPAPMADTAAPVIRSAALTRNRFRAGTGATALSAKRKRTPAGTTLKVDLSERATLAVTVDRLVAGRRARGKCSPTARARKRCTIVKRAGTLTRALQAGAAKIAFSGRLGTRKLAAGSYRLTLVATDAAGNRSAARTLRFTLVPR